MKIYVEMEEPIPDPRTKAEIAVDESFERTWAE